MKAALTATRIGCALVMSAWLSPPASLATVEPPFIISLSGPELVRAGDEIELALQITRAPAERLPMTLRLELPVGVELIGAAPDPVIVDHVSHMLTRRIRLRVLRVPEAELVVHLSTVAADSGAHASARYRFGRPVPRAVPSFKRVQIRGRNGRIVGRPVSLDAPAAPRPPGTRRPTPTQ